MTLLCAPVKQLVDTEKVELQELDYGTHKFIYKKNELAYIDTDWRLPLPKADIKKIVSYHNFTETPGLEQLIALIQQKHPEITFYKLATYARSTLDSLRMLEFLKHHQSVIGLCMGELGSITRILAPIVGVPFMYAPLSQEEMNAPGQLIADQLKEIYHFHQLNPHTKIFGLIGDPVHRSPGHFFHNKAFRSAGVNAVYVKMVVQVAELKEFFSLAKKLPFGGLSVTTPLKEVILSFLDEIDPLASSMGSVNTVIFKNSQIIGYNTDGAAALDVLGPVENKTIVILGAGGAARAIAFTALQRGADVILVNRTPSKAQLLAETLGCFWSATVPPYDILINATSATMPIDKQVLIPGKIVMEIALYDTEFLQKARRAGCSVIEGMQMYHLQAVAQQNLFKFVTNQDFFAIEAKS